MLDTYLQHQTERNAQGIPALPLNAEQVAGLCELFCNPPAGRETLLLTLLAERVPPGVDQAARVKAEFLGRVLCGEITSPLIDAEAAIDLLVTMLGGYNIPPLVAALDDQHLGDKAAAALSGLILVYDAFDEVLAKAKRHPLAMQVVESWAAASGFWAGWSCRNSCGSRSSR